MTNSLKWTILVPLGFVAGLVLTFPMLVVIGLYCLIIPGLILAKIPTVFVYLLATVIIRDKLPLRSDAHGYLAAFSLTLVLSASFMSVYRIPEKWRFDRAALAELKPPQKVNLAGDIFLHWPDEIEGQESEVVCDFLCTALLDIPGVTSVTRTCKAGAATFRLGTRNAGTLVVPNKPERLLIKFHELDDEPSDHLRRFQLKEQQKQDVQSLQAAWPLRIASGEELRRDQPLTAEAAEWTIELVKEQEAGQPIIERLEIRDKDGKVVVRKSLVKHEVPSSLFRFQFGADVSNGGRPRPRFTVGTSEISNRMADSFDGVFELLRVTNIARPAVPQDIGNRVEKIVREVLDNPKANEIQLLSVPTLLSQLPNATKGEHIDIFARLLLDERIADPWQSFDALISSETDLTPLRAGLAQRYLYASSDDYSKSWYVKKLVSLPDGTFKEPSREERAIFREALSYHHAWPFWERMADQGPSVLPELLSLLESSREQSPSERAELWEGIRNVFKRLGFDAAPATPKILAMIQKSPDDFLDTRDNTIAWLITLRLMGVEQKDLQRLLQRMSPEEKGRILEAVNQEVRQHL
jgi:hypothetical protein